MATVPSPGTTGNDIIIPGDGFDTLYGDPFDVSPLSTGRGGNDRLSATGDGNNLIGDAHDMSGDARGGNDRLSADRLSATGYGGNFLFGDAQSMSGDARGGNDRLTVTG